MYHVMMILTDGEIHDMKETINLIVELSKFPVSIIIIGVGHDEFENMKRLDGDNQRLRNSSNQMASRDIV
jgi:Copine